VAFANLENAMNRRPVLTSVFALVVLVASLSASLHAQTIDDGIMMDKHNLFTGFLYTHDTWDQYWEGTLKRVNGNIGTITTQGDIWSVNYGITDRLNIIATIPYVRTRASQGVLRGMNGFQDITLAGKYRFLEKPSTRYGSLRAIAVLSGGTPLTDYTPDFQPLSIGSASKRLSGRGTLNLQSRSGVFLNGSTAYTWRANVTLDRPYYFTDGALSLTDQVAMPNVFDYAASGGYLKRGLMAAFSFSQQRTLGGGDIRRQDIPFISNRMNFSKVGGMVVTPIPKLRDLVFRAEYAYTITGRNVGQATTFTTGLLYRFHLPGSRTQ
jgi:hypothetical protein